MRYFLELAYDGSEFHGWQRQPNAITVQESIESALNKILSEDISIVGCGRTDTGVHASQYFTHFDTVADLADIDLSYKLNAVLPDSIAIYQTFQVDDEAHARFSAIERSYQYRIIRRKDPFELPYAWSFYRDLDLEAMASVTKHFIGQKDFKAFCKQADEKEHHLCDLRKLKINTSEHLITIDITANRFLRNMVRAIVGTLVEYGSGKITEKELISIIDSGDRSEAGVSAPAQGLFLSNISYPKELFSI